MLCENKLTNLVFKNQENSAKHKDHRNKENKKPKNNSHKEYSNEAQGPC